MTMVTRGGMRRWTGALLLALGLACGCEDDERDNHHPPAGQGALIIDNHTADDVSVFLDGVLAGRVGSDSDRAFDREPGTYRMVIADEDDGSQSFRGYVEILENWLTIVDVWSGADIDTYDVRIRYDEPD